MATSQPMQGIVQFGRWALEIALLLSLFLLLNPMYNGDATQKWSYMGKAKFYSQQEIDVSKDWSKTNDRKSFLEKCDASEAIASTEACTCVRNQEKSVQNCLLQHNIPVEISDAPGFLLIVPLSVWFMASTSARMLQGHYAPSGHSADTPNPVGGWKMLRQAYVGGVAMVLILPIILYAATPNKNDFDAMSSVPFFLLFVLATLGTSVLLSLKTAFEALNPMTSDEGEVSPMPFKHITGYCYVNWAFYTHLIVSAPCIAVIIHIIGDSREFSSLVNTALLLCAIFSLDAFANFCSLYWVTVVQHDNDTSKSDGVHREIALVKFFTWCTQAFLLLLFVLTHYIESPSEDLPSPQIVSSMIVILLLLMTLLPDLLREFLDLDYLNLISFRYYGDLVLRISVFWYLAYALSVKKQVLV